jgi:hypothetical protein
VAGRRRKKIAQRVGNTGKLAFMYSLYNICQFVSVIDQVKYIVKEKLKIKKNLLL